MSSRPARSSDARLRLLWDPDARPARGPRRSLTVAKVVHGAIAVADDEGLGAVTMRRVAQQVGVTTMAVYRYVPGKDELFALMVDTALGEPPGFGDVAGDWRRGLERWARRRLGVYRRHPWVLDIPTDRRSLGPNATAWLEAALGVVAGLVADDAERVRTVELVDSYTRGSAPGSGTTDDHPRAEPVERAERLNELIDRQRFPLVAQVVAAGAFPPSDAHGDTFQHGLRRVLDGIELNAQNTFIPGVGRRL